MKTISIAQNKSTRDSIQKKYLLKAIEYEHQIYQNFEDTAFFIQTIFNKINCYKAIENFGKVETELKRLSKIPLPFDENLTYNYEKALFLFFQNNIDSSINLCRQIIHQYPDSLMTANFYLLFTLNLNEKYDYKTAKKYAIKYILKLPLNVSDKDSLIKKVNEWYLTENLPKIHKKRLSLTLSTFIPGAGQIYNKNIIEGILSLCFHAGSIYLGVWEFTHQNFFTAYFFGIGLSSKFYTGNLKRAVYLTQTFNEKNTRKFNQKVQNFLTQIKMPAKK